MFILTVSTFDIHIVYKNKHLLLVEELREEIKIGDQGGLEDDRHVRGIKKLDRIAALVAALLLRLDRKIYPPPLEVDDDDEY